MTDPRGETILTIVAKETGIERSRLVPEATIADLGIPSIDMIQAIFALESHYDIEIPVVAERSGAEFTTVGDLVAHVLATLDAKA
ncbi:MAG: acyl carrier protein [Acidisphaera sp.]|nr:acyl carrier protein [Acidisphaera sp.]